MPMGSARGSPFHFHERTERPEAQGGEVAHEEFRTLLTLVLAPDRGRRRRRRRLLQEGDAGAPAIERRATDADGASRAAEAGGSARGPVRARRCRAERERA